MSVDGHGMKPPIVGVKVVAEGAAEKSSVPRYASIWIDEAGDTSGVIAVTLTLEELRWFRQQFESKEGKRKNGDNHNT
jgi:hypothetical protein